MNCKLQPGKIYMNMGREITRKFDPAWNGVIIKPLEIFFVIEVAHAHFSGIPRLIRILYKNKILNWIISEDHLISIKEMP